MITTNLNCLIAKALDKKYEMKPIDNKDIEKLLKTEYSEAFKCAKMGNFIYRGQDDNFDNTSFISIPDYRISEHTSNEYTHLMSDILPSWKNWPKRNHSFICTNNFNKARTFGNSTFMVFPKNGTKLGICPEEDIWDSFELISSLPDFNYHLEGFVEWILYNVGNEDAINIYSLLNYADKNDVMYIFDIIDKIIIKYMSRYGTMQYPWGSDEMNYILEQYKKGINNHNKNISLIKILDNFLNPKKNNFKLISIKNYLNFNSKNNEIWFNNKALFIPIELEKSVKKL